LFCIAFPSARYYRAIFEKEEEHSREREIADGRHRRDREGRAWRAFESTALRAVIAKSSGWKEVETRTDSREPNRKNQDSFLSEDEVDAASSR
jgi:hypothetical protein